MKIQINAPSTNIGASARPDTDARAPMPATNTYTSAVPSAVEFGNLATGVADRSNAIVVTSRMRTVVSENNASIAGKVAAIQPDIPGAIDRLIQVTLTTIASKYRYCGIVGAVSSSTCDAAASSINAMRSSGTRAHLLNLSAKSRDISNNGSHTT